MRLRLQFFVVMAVILGFTGISSAAGVTAAVIAGVADYKSINDLSYCAKDARDVYKKTLELSYMKKSRVKLLTNKKASKQRIRSAIKTMGKKVKAGDVFMFFFSGHGTYGPDVAPLGDTDGNDEYICPWNTISGNYSSMISDDELYSWLSVIVNRGAKVLVVLDTCYSGGALKAQELQAKAGVNVKLLPGTPERKATSAGGFSKDMNMPGFIVMTASDDTELSSEWAWFQNGVFTHLFLHAMGGHSDDSYILGGIGDDDWAISAAELFHHATVVENTDYRYSGTSITEYFEQTPQVYGDDATELFYLK